MKKKAPAPDPVPAKTSQPPPKQAAPPVEPAQTPATVPSLEEGRDLSETPVESPTPAPLKPLRFDPARLPAIYPPYPGLAGYQPIQPFKLAQDPLSLIDWSAMRQPFLTRGLSLGDRDGSAIVQNWTFTYNNMVSIGLDPALAAKVANIGTPLAYDFSLARDFPTTEEKMDQDIEKMLGPGKKLGKIVVPIITPDTLSFIVEKTTGKKLDFRF